MDGSIARWYRPPPARVRHGATVRVRQWERLGLAIAHGGAPSRARAWMSTACGCSVSDRPYLSLDQHQGMMDAQSTAGTSSATREITPRSLMENEFARSVDALSGSVFIATPDSRLDLVRSVLEDLPVLSALMDASGRL